MKRKEIPSNIKRLGRDFRRSPSLTFQMKILSARETAGVIDHTRIWYRGRSRVDGEVTYTLVYMLALSHAS